MWVILGIASACLLGLYDVFKKKSLNGNAVIPVLFINTAICMTFFLPGIIGSVLNYIEPASALYVPQGTLHEHIFIILKSIIVLSSWICGYYAIRKLPLTIVGPINATRPVMTLIGALLIFGEKLNPMQWAGVLTAIISFWMLSKSGKKEGIDFKSDKWIFLLVSAAVLGSISGLYDKYLLSPEGQHMDRNFVQGWYYIYQFFLMSIIFLVDRYIATYRHKSSYTAVRTAYPAASPDIPNGKDSGEAMFEWRWTIPLISLTLTASDLTYMIALTIPGAMISILSMLRRSSVLVSFVFGAFVFHEKNIKGKAIDLSLVLLSLIFLVIGTLMPW